MLSFSARVTNSSSNSHAYGINKDSFIYRLTVFPKTKVLRMVSLIYRIRSINRIIQVRRNLRRSQGSARISYDIKLLSASGTTSPGSLFHYAVVLTVNAVWVFVLFWLVGFVFCFVVVFAVAWF